MIPFQAYDGHDFTEVDDSYGVALFLMLHVFIYFFKYKFAVKYRIFQLRLL